MNSNDVMRGAAIVASAAALLLVQGCGDSDEKTSSTAEAIKCLGANECKAMSECAGGKGMSECKGMNECKGMGWIYTPTAAECTDKGGTPQA
ncbi:MAG: hypothetical protein ACOY0T_19645 [Myxococcota bacterium]